MNFVEPDSTTTSFPAAEKDKENDVYDLDLVPDTNTVPKMNSTVWTIYLGIMFLALFLGITGAVVYPLSTFVYGELQSFDLNAIPEVIGIVLGIFLIPVYAKLSDIFGRPKILLIVLLLYTVGYLIMGLSYDFLVYTIGTVINSLGNVGKSILIPVIVADLLSVENRGIGYMMLNFPDFIALFAGLPLIQPIKELGWRWLFRIMAIGTVVTSIPLMIALFKYNKTLNLPKQRLNWGLVKELDLVGLVLLTISLGLLLIPFSLVIREPDGWSSTTIIVMLVVGIILLLLLFVWELKYSTNPFVPRRILFNKPLMIVVAARAVLRFESAVNWVYFTPYLIISRDITETHSEILNRGFHVSWFLSGLIAGILVKKFKWTRSLIWIGCIINIIGLALTIPSRHPHSSDGFIITAEAFIGTGWGFVYCVALVMYESMVDYKDIATISALVALLDNVVSSAGIAIASTVWNKYLSINLINLLPSEYHDQIPSLLSNIYLFRDLPIEVKPLWLEALSNTQLIMCSISVAMAVVGSIIAIFIKPLKMD